MEIPVTMTPYLQALMEDLQNLMPFSVLILWIYWKKM